MIKATTLRGNREVFLVDPPEESYGLGLTLQATLKQA